MTFQKKFCLALLAIFLHWPAQGTEPAPSTSEGPSEAEQEKSREFEEQEKGGFTPRTDEIFINRFFEQSINANAQAINTAFDSLIEGNPSRVPPAPPGSV